jgi:hypothetical protein
VGLFGMGALVYEPDNSSLEVDQFIDLDHLASLNAWTRSNQISCIRTSFEGISASYGRKNLRNQDIEGL